MEKSIIAQIKKEFDCKENDIRTYSPLTLAYIGDSIYDLIIRTVVVERGNKAANDLHKKSVKYVNATTQARLVEMLQDFLTEEEIAVFKRGRNAKSYTSAKNASITDYRKATGLEALFGYLYLTDQMDRIFEILKEGLQRLDLEL